jgi:hypothetical protein
MTPGLSDDLLMAIETSMTETHAEELWWTKAAKPRFHSGKRCTDSAPALGALKLTLTIEMKNQRHEFVLSKEYTAIPLKKARSRKQQPTQLHQCG